MNDDARNHEREDFINVFAFSRKLQLKFSKENGGQENTSQFILKMY
jgi:hypothetical protein